MSPDHATLPNPFSEGQACFGCSPTHPIGFRLAFHKSFDEEGEWVATDFTPGPQYEGPPGIMHGGLVATLADEVAAWAIIAQRDKFGFTAELRGRLRAPVRTGKVVHARARITEDTSRTAKVVVQLRQEGTLVFAGDFSFVMVDRAGAERLLGGPLPPAWERFLR
jgi:acyl-coenzyme A thioesterase PaaI-like protein